VYRYWKMPEPRPLYAHRVLLPGGWAENVAITLDTNGVISGVRENVPAIPQGAELLQGVVVPGIPNCHSHAFQRAMVGLTETRSSSDDSFWSWRDAMYRLLGQIGPEQLQAISEQLYIEMLKQGYTSVAEFHYLHHSNDGRPYEDPTEMSQRVIAAAQSAGIHITHLPVLYCHSDFGGGAPEAGQRRFVNSIEQYQQLLAQLHSRYRDEPNVRLGMAPHSLRAVSEPLLRESIAGLDGLDNTAPIHIHIAEQQREVDSCLAHTGARPVEWLLREFEVNKRWCLVHATHLVEEECRKLAASGAVAGLCPTTEANLGDGLFPAEAYLQAGGRFAIGSDSQVCLDPARELQLLEYGQRLFTHGRTLLADEQTPSVGEKLLRSAAAGGAQALAINSGRIEVGARADLLVLDDQHASLYGKAGSELLDSWVFACNNTPVKDVMVAGQWQVRDGVHAQQDAVAQRFRQAIDSMR
jgi:formimidoylglutamate deiminase